MIGVIVYGSLLGKRELAKVALDPLTALPVRVTGFRRSFDQEPTWRRRPSLDRGVLSVVAREDAWLNALLIPGLEPIDLARMDYRERGYDRVALAAGQVQPFVPAQALPALDATYIYRGKPEKRNVRLTPHPPYLELCLAGARQWGDVFLRQFLETTFIGPRPLSGDLADAPF